ncbi:hypothetical protein [Pseudomonas sp. SDO5271_S396]
MSSISSAVQPHHPLQIEVSGHTPSPREKVQVLVKASDVDRTMEIAFRTAEALGMRLPNADVGGPEQARFATPENVYPIKFDFRPDGPDGTYTHGLQQKINQFKQQFEERLRHEGIEDIGPDMFA